MPFLMRFSEMVLRSLVARMPSIVLVKDARISDVTALGLARALSEARAGTYTTC